MSKIQNAAAYVFIVAAGILTIISVLGVWDFFSRDVINKSFLTIGLLGIVAVIVIVAGHFIDSAQSATGLPVVPGPFFPMLRKFTLSILVAAVSLLALLGVLAIWEFIKDKDVLYKSLSSLGILAFGAFVVTLTCLEREGKLQRGGKNVSAGVVILIIILAWVFFSMIRAIF